MRDLTFFGIAAIIGAGSFSSIGSACFSGGPGVIFYLLFVLLPVALLPCVMQSLRRAFRLQVALIPMHMFPLVKFLPG